VGLFYRRQVALPRLTPGAVLHRLPKGIRCACLDFPLPYGNIPFGSDCSPYSGSIQLIQYEL